MLNRKIFKFSLLLASNLVAGYSYADMTSATQRLTSEIGTQSALTATATCDLTAMMGSNGGNLGTLNQIPCFINKTGLGITGASGVTSVNTIGSQTFTSHVVLSSPGPTIDGVAYTYELKVWTCGSNCTTTTAFLPAIYMAFNATDDKVTNNGIMINHFAASSGTIKGTAFAKWDSGTGASATTINLVMVDCSSSPTTAISAKYTRSGTAAKLNELVSQASGSVSRTALAWDTAANAGNWYQDTTVNAGGDTPTFSSGFTRTATATDYTYSSATANASYTAAAFQTGVSGTTLSGSSFQGATCSATSGVAAVAVGTGVLTTVMSSATNGMTTNPPNI